MNPEIGTESSLLETTGAPSGDSGAATASSTSLRDSPPDQNRTGSDKSGQDRVATLEEQLRETRKQLQREQVTRRHLEQAHDQLRYRIVDRLNDLLKRMPWVWKPAKALFSQSAQMRAESGVGSLTAGENGDGLHIKENGAALNSSGLTPHLKKGFGVNLAGHLNSEKGVGEAVRISMRSLDAADIPYSLTNVHDPESENVEEDIPDVLEGTPYGINLVHVSMDLVPAFASRNESYFVDRYNIGCWNWELSSFPRELRDAFCYFNEIWVPSNHTMDSISRVSPVPVVRIPYAIKLDVGPSKFWTRERFGLNKDTFVFLFLFDFLSHMERKNPLGLVKAFERAFTPQDDALLFIKCAHSEEAKPALAQLQHVCQRPNIRLFDSVLPREGLDALMSCSDAYVSLHRAEGYGLTLTEAMSMAKPVIATAYSSNLDFMTPGNSFLVKYGLTEIQRDHGPYKKGAAWADPDLDHAAELMRFVYENREQAAAIARQGRDDVYRNLHPNVVGKMMRERLCPASTAMHR